jgi:hypothetical protein
VTNKEKTKSKAPHALKDETPKGAAPNSKILPTRHWNFADPAETQATWEEKLAEFRCVRDQIRERFHEFAAGNPRTGNAPPQ